MPKGLPHVAKDNLEKRRSAATAAVDAYDRPGPRFPTAHCIICGRAPQAGRHLDEGNVHDLTCCNRRQRANLVQTNNLIGREAVICSRRAAAAMRGSGPR